MIRTILHYPDKRLREKGVRIMEVTPEVQRLVDDMAETMYAAPGVGLAATQIGEALQIFVIDVAEEENEPSDLRVFVNPEILEKEDSVLWSEGCPWKLRRCGVTEEIERAARVRVARHGSRGAHVRARRPKGSSPSRFSTSTTTCRASS